VLISGQTANYSTRWPSLEALATARAEQVKADLVVRGVSATRLTTKGLGYQANPPQVDAATAALNRSVTFSASPLP
jgi:outer membrane protein OmpA-like peptidoglycan-associated protein